MAGADGRGQFDDVLRRRINIERYSGAQAKKLQKFLKALEGDILGKLATAAQRGSTKLDVRQQEALLKSVRELSADVYAQVGDEARKGMTQLAGSEHAKAQDTLGKAAGEAGLNFTTQRLTPTAAFEIAASKPMNGALLKDWITDLEPSHRKRIEQALRISFAEGEGLENASRRLREAGLQNGRGLEFLIRTSNAHIAAQVDQAVTDANADIIEGVEWVSTLDGRTTDICRSRDGKVYPTDSGPRPPAHIGCRSTTIKRLKGVEPVKRETYAEWLRRQDAETQNDILGPARGKLFRDGGLSVDRFIDMKGKRLTLDELGAKQGGTVFSNFGTQIQTPGARKAADFLGLEPSDAGRMVERMLGKAGPSIVAEGAADNIPVKLTMSGSKDYVSLTGAVGYAKVEVTGNGFRMERVFTRVDGKLEVENKLLSFHEDLQGKGYATQILKSSIAEYEALGVSRISVTANIDVGGYTWARFGYSPVNPAEFVAEVRSSVRLKRLTGKLSSDDEDLIERVLSRSNNLDRLPADLARIDNAAGKKIGKEALLGTYWEGYLDMTNANALAFFKTAVGG